MSTTSVDAVSTASAAPVLQVEGLQVDVRTPDGHLEVLRDVSFSLRSGQTLGLVGESGSGKSMTAYALAGLLPRAARLVQGSVVLDGKELTGLSTRAMADVRGADFGMIFQEPRRSLNPAFTVGEQIAESVRRHHGVSRREARKIAVEMLDRVRIPHPERRMSEYPHAFSGGMCQRVMLAMALVCKPKVLIADEPTTALDVTVQASVLDLLRELQDEMGLAVLLITHDLGVVAEMCDDVAVMYAGRIVERADVRSLFFNPQHPYADGLIRSIPDVSQPRSRFEAIPGSVPPLFAMPDGCRFHPRCPYAIAACEATEPVLEMHTERHWSACLRAEELDLEGVRRG